MTKPITWLHLSDLHLGQPGKPVFWQVHDEFRTHLIAQVKKLGSPDLLIFTGDLTYSGQKDQFEALDNFFDVLMKVLREAGAKQDPVLLPVPGNHDLAWRTKRQALQYNAFDEYSQLEKPHVATVREMLWKDRDSSLVKDTFQEYEAWFERRVAKQWKDRGIQHHRSFFPGDFSATIAPPDRPRLRVVGLNSAWIQYSNSDVRGRLHLSTEQFQAALPQTNGSSPLDFFDPDEPALLLQHHPLSWLAPRAASEFREAIYPPQRFTANLFGHMHEAMSEFVAVSGNSPRCYYQAPSLCGLEHYGKTNEERAFGYTIGRLTADHELRIWPFKRVPRGGGSWDFDHDQFFPPAEDGAVLRQARTSGPRRVREDDPQVEVEVYREYLVGLRSGTAYVRMQGMGSKPGAQAVAAQFPIEEIYTRLRTRTLSGARGELSEMAMSEMLRDRVDLAEVLPKESRLLIVGQPGAGKSTFLQLVAQFLARDLLAEDPPPGFASWRSKELGFNIALPPLLPVLIRLERLVDLFLAKDGRPDDRERLLDLLDEERAGSRYGVDRARFRRDIEAGRVLLLLDGLDEVADPTYRKRMLAILDDAAQRWKKARFVVTSRPFEFTELRNLGFAHTEVEPFGEKEIDIFVERWVRGFRGIAAGEPITPEAAKHVAELRQAIRERPRLGLLASNPVMLTSLCVIHWNEGRLPDSKQRVYRAVMRWLLAAREEERKAAGFTNSLAERGFASLALAMLAGPQGKRTTIDFDDAALALDKAFARDYPDLDDRGRRDRARDWLRFECLGSGIVQEVAGNRLRFWHLTFQEFYAALELSWEDDCWDAVKDKLDDAQWRETIELLPGCLHEGGVGKVDRFLDRILASRPQPSELAADARIAGIVGRLLDCLAGIDYNPPPEVRTVFKECLDRALAIFTLEGAAKVEVKTRIAAAEALGRGGDPRLKSLDANLIEVPGTGVRMCKFLVTVEEFQEFVEHEGYAEKNRHLWDPEGWEFRQKEKWEAPESWFEQLKTPNRPVVAVSWYEARAYCRFRSTFGRLLRLPKEKEWGAAAMPEHGDYPWSDREPETAPDAEMANFDKSGVGAPTPVGVYPRGAGRFGHLDLAGNVWEWCEDEWSDGIDADRVAKWGPGHSLRGASWYDPAWSLAAAVRSRNHATLRHDDIGFRVVSVPASTVIS